KRFLPTFIITIAIICCSVLPSFASSTWVQNNRTLESMYPGGFKNSLVNGVITPNPQTVPVLKIGSTVYSLLGTQYGSSKNLITWTYNTSMPSGALTVTVEWNNINITLDSGDTFALDTQIEGLLPEDRRTGNVNLTLDFEPFDPNNELENDLPSLSVNTELYDREESTLYPSGGYYTDIKYSATANTPGVINRITLVFKYNYVNTGTITGLQLSTPNGINIGYGNASSPNAPAYAKPDSKPFDDLESAESDALSSTEDGLESANNILDGFLDHFFDWARGFDFVEDLFEIIVGKSPFVYFLISISMGLGMCAVIFGLTGSIVSAAERNSNSARRKK
ncbi:MAG: hypothetical protein ACLRFE_04665, partial [Clostridia bacterium]